VWDVPAQLLWQATCQLLHNQQVRHDGSKPLAVSLASQNESKVWRGGSLTLTTTGRCQGDRRTNLCNRKLLKLTPVNCRDGRLFVSVEEVKYRWQRRYQLPFPIFNQLHQPPVEIDICPHEYTLHITSSEVCPRLYALIISFRLG
jgi:hypothetical protein